MSGPYHSTHMPTPTRKSASDIGAPWLLLSEQEIAEWLIRHPEVTTRNEKIVRCLAWLAQEFSRRASLDVERTTCDE